MKKPLKINKWDQYWKLSIIIELEKKWKMRIFKCECDCWNIKEFRLWDIRSWKTQSCWCIYKTSNIKHWMTYSRMNKIWSWMKTRCNNKNRKEYKDYWGRWIAYDPKWETFEWFYEDMKEWYKDYLSLDRKNSDWNYCKNNCRWSTDKEQQRNKRNTLKYKWISIKEWCEKLELNYFTVKSRIVLYWWDIEKALELK